MCHCLHLASQRHQHLCSNCNWVRLLKSFRGEMPSVFLALTCFSHICICLLAASFSFFLMPFPRQSKECSLKFKHERTRVSVLLFAFHIWIMRAEAQQPRSCSQMNIKYAWTKTKPQTQQQQQLNTLSDNDTTASHRREAFSILNRSVSHSASHSLLQVHRSRTVCVYF